MHFIFTISLQSLLLELHLHQVLILSLEALNIRVSLQMSAPVSLRLSLCCVIPLDTQRYCMLLSLFQLVFILLNKTVCDTADRLSPQSLLLDHSIFVKTGLLGFFKLFLLHFEKSCLRLLFFLLFDYTIDFSLFFFLLFEDCTLPGLVFLTSHETFVSLRDLV